MVDIIFSTFPIPHQIHLLFAAKRLIQPLISRRERNSKNLCCGSNGSDGFCPRQVHYIHKWFDSAVGNTIHFTSRVKSMVNLSSKIISKEFLQWSMGLCLLLLSTWLCICFFYICAILCGTNIESLTSSTIKPILILFTNHLLQKFLYVCADIISTNTQFII